MKIEMLVTKKYVEVDLKLNTKALSRDGVETNGYCDRINEDPKKHYLLAILELCCVHSKATYLKLSIPQGNAVVTVMLLMYIV